MLPPLKRVNRMKYKQLERCYKNVLSQRDRYHDTCVDLENKIEVLENAILAMNQMGNIDKQKVRECYEMVKLGLVT